MVDVDTTRVKKTRCRAPALLNWGSARRELLWKLWCTRLPLARGVRIYLGETPKPPLQGRRMMSPTASVNVGWPQRIVRTRAGAWWAEDNHMDDQDASRYWSRARLSRRRLMIASGAV